jgi:hypothetical protein
MQTSANEELLEPGRLHEWSGSDISYDSALTQSTRNLALTAIFSGVLGVVQKYWTTTGIFPIRVPYRFAKNSILAHVNVKAVPQNRETSQSRVRKYS